MRQALEIAIDYMNERLEDHDCKYQRHPATEAERINILADIETVKEALAQPEHDPYDEVFIAYGLPQPEQEPVAWMYESVCGNDFATRHKPPDYAKNIRPLYTKEQL